MNGDRAPVYRAPVYRKLRPWIANPICITPFSLCPGMGVFSGPPRAVKGALFARSSKTLDGEDDRTRWLARKMGAWVAGLFRPGRERRAPGKTGIRFRTGGPVATRIAGVYTAQ